MKEKEKKEWASSVGQCQKHKPQHPHHVKVSPWGLGRTTVSDSGLEPSARFDPIDGTPSDSVVWAQTYGHDG